MLSASRDDPRRVLVATLVYNGEAFVPSCLESLGRIDSTGLDVEVIVLDDASPAPGWSDRLHDMATELGLWYYRSPRNLGIPRNMNLGLRAALALGFDAIILLNSDVIVPRDLVSSLVAPLGDRSISSVTAWSNQVSVYSLPVAQSHRLADDQDLVDWASARLHDEFGAETIDIPSAMGFCIAIPSDAVADVGLMDPLFGRGYSEEIDWSLRSHELGYRSVLSPGCFVYHAGGGSTSAVGLTDRNQAIIDSRYPNYVRDVSTFCASNTSADLASRGLRRLVLSAAREFGYSIDAGFSSDTTDDRMARFVIGAGRCSSRLAAHFKGFSTSFELDAADAMKGIEGLVGCPPREIRINDHGLHAYRLLEEARSAGAHTSLQVGYPRRIY